MNYFLIVDIL